MLDDFRKSINSTLYERVASPFYGTLIFTWLVWNWKIVYLTLFVNEDTINGNKIDYILGNYAEVNNLVIYPIVSTIILLTIIPFITNGAFWLHLKFHKWRVEKKHEVEKSQLLTLEQSINLRSEIADNDKLFEGMLTGKDSEIKILKIQLEEAQRSASLYESIPDVTNEPITQTADEEQFSEIVAKIINNTELRSHLDLLAEHVNKGWALGKDFPKKVVGFYVSNNLIKMQSDKVSYVFTSLGKAVYREILNTEF